MCQRSLEPCLVDNVQYVVGPLGLVQRPGAAIGTEIVRHDGAIAALPRWRLWFFIWEAYAEEFLLRAEGHGENHGKSFAELPVSDVAW